MSFIDHINRLSGFVAKREFDNKIAYLLYLKDSIRRGGREFERTTIRLKQQNYILKKEKERFEAKCVRPIKILGV
jgi:hypothetical protein